jgi:hypothetical protein
MDSYRNQIKVLIDRYRPIWTPVELDPADASSAIRCVRNRFSSQWAPIAEQGALDG